MNIVFLRGAVPPKNEHPEKLLYSNIESCEDMWTQLFYTIAKELGWNGSVIYTNGNRKFTVDKKFSEIWVPNLSDLEIYPDVIFCRGGFPYYDEFLKRFPKSKKIYYGAGVRFFPQTKFTSYDLFLVDSEKHLKIIQAFKKNVSLFFKPAAKLFKPMNVKKKYDVCFIANATQGEIKRHELLIKTIANTDIKVLNIGNTSDKYIRCARLSNANIRWNGWMLRKELPDKISECRIGVCCSTNYDSCPRVIPEYLACGLPVVVTSNVNFWKEKYITQKTGTIVKESKLLKGIKDTLQKKCNTVDYYNKNLSMNKASAYLCGLIEKIL